MSVSIHDEFRQLCAVATSGCLTDEEQVRLEKHLVQCRECRTALREYDYVAKTGMPGLADDFPVALSDDLEGWSEEGARKEFFARLDSGDERGSAGGDSDYRLNVRRIELKSSKGKVRISPARLVLPCAAAILLAAGMGWFGYRLGRERAASMPLVVAQPPASNVGSTVDPVAALSKERESLSADVDEGNRTIARLSDRIVRQTAEVEKLLQEQQKLNDSLQKAQTEQDQNVSEREALGRSLELSQAELARAKQDLEALQKQRADDAPREAEAEARLAKFSDLLKERDATIDEQRELLARDKDIRDLMGARELYIAEVLDVGRNGETKKPVGRVFYTKGKSLIFYAYDLDQQPGLRNASIFQAWGRRGPNLAQSMNLGIFYVDNAAHKRWVLKFNDAKSLEQIDAVFVTVEPKGGSQKPTGKQLLFAYLRVEPNHP
jgi:uncharacterized protein YoxC